MYKRIETATEIITVGTDQVINVVQKIAIPRNFSFTNIGKVTAAPAVVAPALFTLFIEDYNVLRGAFDDMYEAAWRAYGNTGKLELSFIIC
jgi:hypothetical protein